MPKPISVGTLSRIWTRHAGLAVVKYATVVRRSCCKYTFSQSKMIYIDITNTVSTVVVYE